MHLPGQRQPSQPLSSWADADTTGASFTTKVSLSVSSSPSLRRSDRHDGPLPSEPVDVDIIGVGDPLKLLPLDGAAALAPAAAADPPSPSYDLYAVWVYVRILPELLDKSLHIWVSGACGGAGVAPALSIGVGL